MRKSILISICVTGLAGVTPQALSERISDIALTEAESVATISGTIKSVSSEENTFVVQTKGEDAGTVTVTVNEKTRYTLDGETSTREAVLKAGAEVSVTHTDGVASYVDAFTK
jgi:hypothetical protein